MLGGDANLGFVFWPALNATLYMGGYHYQAAEVKTLAGPRGQLDIDLYRPSNTKNTILNRIAFSAMVQHDSVRKTGWYAGLSFVLNMGAEKQTLSTMQQYLQYPVPRTYGTLVRGNDARVLDLLTNNEGNPFTIAQVSNEAGIDHAIANQENVIAVQGSITGLSQINLNPGQSLTGGDYTLTNGVTLTPGRNGKLTAATGEDLIQISNNNRIENIILNSDANKGAIVNDLKTSFGNVSINNVTANSKFKFIVTDGLETSNLSVTNNQLNLGDINFTNGIHLQVDSGAVNANFINNSIGFGAGEGNRGIYIYSSAIGNAVSSRSTIESINNNTIQFAKGDGNAGNHIEAADTENALAEVTIHNLQNNIISFAEGDYNTGIHLLVASGSGQGSLTAYNVINNEIAFEAGNYLIGLDTTVGYLIGTGKLTIDTVYNNNFKLPTTGTDNKGFNFIAGDALTTQITIYIRHNGENLSSANNNASISQQGNVTIILD
jgi:hypothetical protein